MRSSLRLLVPLVLLATAAQAQQTGTKLLPDATHTGGLFGFALDADRGHLLIGSPTDCVPRQAGQIQSRAWDGVAWQRVGTPVAEPCAGYALDVAGSRAVVGQPFSDDFRPAGTVQVLARAGEGWTVVDYLSPDEEVVSGFGAAVAYGGNRIAVGAPEANRVYLYEEGTTGWTLLSVLSAPTPNATDRFGYAVALTGNQLLVGAPGTRNRPEPAHESGESVYETGAAYLYEWADGTWHLAATWQDDLSLNLGTSVALIEDQAAVGAPSSLTALNAGFVWLFEKGGGQWAQEQTLTYGGPDVRFGHTLRLGSGVLLVGAPGRLGAGAAHLYHQTEAGWESVAQMVSDDPTGADGFGYAVAMNGGTVFVGAPFDAEGGTEAGAVYLFSDAFDTATEQEPGAAQVSAFSLAPNPATGHTTLRFTLTRPAAAKVELFDIRGARVGDVEWRQLSAGTHAWPLALERLASGLYLVRIWVDGQATTRAVTLVE